MAADQPTFSHSGQRYLLGYTGDDYGIWDRQAPGPPVRKFAKSEAGWTEAWAAYQSMEAAPSAPAVPPVNATADTTPPSVAAQSPGAPAAQSSPSAPTTPIPSAAPAAAAAAAPPFKVTGRLVAQVLSIAGWALLVLYPLAGIALMTAGGAGFYLISQGLANIAFGVGLWGICQALASWVRRNP